MESNHNGSRAKTGDDDEILVPNYVCCVVTEGVWVWFAAVLLFVVLMFIATLKYCRKRLSKPKFFEKNKNLLLRQVLEDDRGTLKSIRKAPIPVQEFLPYYNKRRKLKTIDRLETSRILQSCPKQDLPTTIVAHEPINAKKNSDLNTVPYDFNRVKLELSDAAAAAAAATEASGATDYVNASRVEMPSQQQFIVSQSPAEGSVAEFWQLIWQERSPAVVMLTKTYELIKVMSACYWPIFVDKKEEYGEFSVRMLVEESYAHYKVRRLLVSKEGESRMVWHYHFLNWPAFANPAPNSLIAFRKRFREDLARFRSGGDDGPPLVHCCSGGSRSGAFVLIDENLSSAAASGHVDIFGTAKHILTQRKGLFMNPRQLRYIYDVVADHLLCGETSIPITDLLPMAQHKSKKDRDGDNDYAREHKLLNKLIPRFTIGDCAAAHRAENRSKNRNAMVVPPDASRPYLASFQSNDHTDYVNGVFADGYRRADEFICTEWPMQDTMPDFWSMVYDHDIKTVVVLNHQRPSGKFPQFWPDNTSSGGGQRKSFGPVFCVEHESGRDHEGGRFRSFELKLTKHDVAPHRPSRSWMRRRSSQLKDISSLVKVMKSEPPRYLRLFQIQCWPATQMVPNSTLALVSLIDAVEKWRGNDAEHIPEDKVVVVSNDGYSRCGVYCVTTSCIEQAYHRQEVDVFQAVKTVRKNRTQLVASSTEYKYCYDVVLHYVLNYCRAAVVEETSPDLERM